MNSVSFRLPEIDRELTKEAVESAFETYRFFKYIYNHEEERIDTPKMVGAYPETDADLIRGSENSSTTERCAIHNVDENIFANSEVVRIERAVQKLGKTEQEIIRQRYMLSDDELLIDAEIMDKLKFGRTKYYQIKSSAFYKLAFALRIQVLKDAD